MSDSSNEPLPLTSLESALRAEWRSVVLVTVVSLVAWAWVVVAGRDMYGSMSGASRWMMTPTWDAAHVLLLWAMWATMMAAMMLPSAVPVLLLYGGMVRRQRDERAPALIHAFTAGYLGAWALFSVGATGLQRTLSSLWVLSPMMEVTSARVGGAVLLVAGAYQWSSLKQVCLSSCQSPFGFLANHWRRGIRGAAAMGLRHGLYCVGCCWALMLVLFVGGVMNLAVIAALTAFVAFEKLGLFGRYGVYVSGVALTALGAWMALG